MRRTSLFSLLALLGTCFVVPQVPAHAQGTPVNLILDTDMGPDYDDVGAMAVMHSLADSGQVNILATVACNQSKYIAATLSALNTYFKRPNIPVGVVRGRGVNLTAGQKWDSLVVARYPHKIKSNEQAEDALALYRRILAAQPDGSVTIVTVGFLTNMADLLISKPDQYSSLSGQDLIKKKVKKLVCMAGRFPEGREFNVDRDPVSSKIVFDDWPTMVLFSGFEIGQAVYTGLPLTQNDKIQNSPVKDVFVKSIPMSKQDEKGRMSWDQTAVLVAIKGPEKYYTLTEGRFVANDDGSNAWNSSGKNHFRLVEKMPVPQVERVIEAFMAR